MFRIVFLICLLPSIACADILEFTTSGEIGIHTTRVTGRLVFNAADEIIYINRLSYQGSADDEVGRIDLEQPYSGSYDGQTIAISAMGSLDRYPLCGAIAAFEFSGQMAGPPDLSFTLTYPTIVPEDCTLTDHVAVGQMDTMTKTEKVPEPSAFLLMAMLPLMLHLVRSSPRNKAERIPQKRAVQVKNPLSPAR